MSEPEYIDDARERHQRARNGSVPCPSCGSGVCLIVRFKDGGREAEAHEFFRLYRKLRDAGHIYYSSVEDVAETFMHAHGEGAEWKEPHDG